MTAMALYITRGYFQRFGVLFNVLSRYGPHIYCIKPSCTTTLDVVANNLLKSHFDDPKKDHIYLMKIDTLIGNDYKHLFRMTQEQIDEIVMNTLRAKNHKKIEVLIKECERNRKNISLPIIYNLFRAYSFSGDISMINLLQKYALKRDPRIYLRNGEYLHYVARAQCMKGNSDQGLTLLRDCYEKYENLRSLYRIMLRDLITDSVQHRSEASLVIFKKHILYYSEAWNDHYPVLCFWHVCWASTWFSDQMLANELLDLSEPLRGIISDRAPALCINILNNEFNEDAVTRLMQQLLKYKMMVTYAKVLQILFGYKLRNGDVRGCKEIIHHCEAIGVSLPSDQQGRFIKMIINKPASPSDFKLKF